MTTPEPNELSAAAGRVRRRRAGETLKAVSGPLPLGESLAASLRDVSALADGYLALAPRPGTRTEPGTCRAPTPLRTPS